MAKLAALKTKEQRNHTPEMWQQILHVITNRDSTPMPDLQASQLVEVMFKVYDALPKDSLSSSIVTMWMKNHSEFPDDSDLFMWLLITWSNNAIVKDLVQQGLDNWQNGVIGDMDTFNPQDMDLTE